MFKLFIIILQILAILGLSIIVISNSFVISFEINDLIYSVSSSFFLIFFLILFFLIFIIQSFYFKAKYKFSKFKFNKKIRIKEKGYNSFVNGMIALANKDYKKAINESNKISNYLDDSPSLSLLLKSEVYKLEKKYDKLNIIYEKMSKDPNTENLGLRGIMEQYLRAQDYHHAFLYGEKLFNNNPNIEKIYETLVNIIAKINNWHQLINITDKAFSKKIIEKETYQNNKSIGYYEIAKIKQHGDIKESIKLIQKALSLRKNFPAYVNLYVELLIQNENFNIAKKIIKKAWENSFHTDLKSSILKLSKNSSLEISHLTKYITSTSSDNEKSKLLLVEAFIAEKKWDNARNQIRVLLETKPKKEVCLLMAKIEEGDVNDIQKADSWKMRAQNGISNNIWICRISNKEQNEWSSVSKSGHFNSLEWRQPNMVNKFEITPTL